MTHLLRTVFAISLSSYLAGCSSGADDGAGGASGLGGRSSGGASAFGGQSSGGASNGGSNDVGSGGAPQSGGASSGGTTSGGASAGGSAGAQSTGGNAARGGAPSAQGGKGSGGATAAGGSAAGGDGACPLPTTFKWTSGGPIASPKNGMVSIKDFTHVTHNNKHIVYMTTHDTGSSWGSAMMTFDDWPDAANAAQQKVSFGVAPTLFYFTPKQQWVIAYQWGGQKFSYRTSSDPTNPSGWSGEKALYTTGSLPSGDTSGTGPIDQTVICDAAKCYLFFAGDNGSIYRSSMPIGSFPGTFPAAERIMKDTAQKLFEAVQVYSIQGSNKYLMLVEAQGNGRYFRAWTATELGGSWTLLTDNFAIKSNVTFSQNWTNDISHGDLVRSSPDETFPIDPCNLQLLFQGRDPNAKVDYGLLPYKLGLLTLAK